MRIALLLALVGVVVGCGPNDEIEKQREAERKALLEKAEKLKAATRPNPDGRAPAPVKSKAELVAACEGEDAASCQGACALGDGESCVRLGTLFEEGRGGVPENFESARVFHRKACDMGTGSGCYALALFFKLGKSIPKNPKKAARYFDKGCKLGYEPACVEVKSGK